jgi:hypothetical protein
MNHQLRRELSGVELTDEQIETIESGLCFIPTMQRAGYVKKIADRLRPIRDIQATDVAYHVSAVLVGIRRYNECEDRARQRTGWVRESGR